MFNKRLKREIEALKNDVLVLKTRVDYMQHDVQTNIDRFNLTMNRVGNHFEICPECKDASFMKYGADHAGHCFNCGYPKIQASSGAVDLGR